MVRRWVVFVVACLALAGCRGGPPPVRVVADLDAGQRVVLCDATLQLSEGEVTVERAMPPEPLALATVALLPVLLLLVLLALKKMRPVPTLVTMAVLLLLAAGLTAFAGTERFTFAPEHRQIRHVEGWFLDLLRTNRAIPYTKATTLCANEEQADETLYLRVWLRQAPDASMRIIECRGSLSTTEGLRQTLPAVAAAIERHAGLR